MPVRSIQYLSVFVRFTFCLCFEVCSNIQYVYADWKNIDLNMFEYIDLFKERNEKEKRNETERNENKNGVTSTKCDADCIYGL